MYKAQDKGAYQYGMVSLTVIAGVAGCNLCVDCHLLEEAVCRRPQSKDR